jgi:hypothetical protein
VSPDYFSTLGVRILDGRNFTSADMPTSPRVAIVNKVMAEMYWPHQGAIGKHFRLRSLDGPDYEVVGVSADYKVRAVAEPPTPYIHYARSQQPSRANVVVARTRGDASALVALMRRELLALEPDLVFPASQTLQRNVDTTLLPARLAAAILSAVGVIAVGLASAGLFGVIAYTVTLRARAIGIRMALGARSSDIIGDVMRHGLTLALAGALLGAVLASGAARLMSRVLYHVSAGDPIAWAAAIIALFSASVLANVVPARRASRVDPMVALRCE